MQETVVGKAIKFEQNRLTTILQNQLKQSDIDALKELLKDSSGLYEINSLSMSQKILVLAKLSVKLNEIYKYILYIYLLKSCYLY